MPRQLDPEVQYALVRNFARQTPINIAITTAALIFTSWMVWPWVPPAMVGTWLALHACLVVLLLARWIGRRIQRVRRVSAPTTISVAERATRSERRAILFALISGSLWGATVLALPFLPERYGSALTIIVGALAGGATTTLSAIPFAAGGYALCAILPFSIYFFSRGTDPASITLGVLAAAMALAMTWASRSVHGTFLDDIAARVGATKALNELRSDREDWLQVAQSTDAFALFDQNQTLKFNNQPFAALISLKEGLTSLSNAPWAALIDRLAHSEDINMGLLTHNERRQRYMALADAPGEQLVERLADGRWIRSVVRKTGSGSFVWLLQDISAERQRENTEIKLRARLAEAKQLQTIGQFAGGVAHDFNNVLGAIQSFAEYISHLPVAEEAQRAARRIVGACERGAGMVQNILQLATASRIDKEVFKFEIAFDQAVNLLETRKPELAVFDSRNTSGDVSIDANVSQIMQLMMNLVMNAFTALKKGPGKVTLSAEKITIDTTTATQFFEATAGSSTATQSPDGSAQYVFGILLAGMDYVRITAADTGSGIDAKLLPRIFDPFVTTKENTVRTGFGLAVVRSVVLASEGALSVQTRIGQGTKFEVYIPIAAARENVTEQIPQLEVPKTERVLIVDDDQDVADGLTMALSSLGHDIQAVYDPRDAIAVLSEKPDSFSVIIVDISMPHMNGDELAAEAKKIAPKLRIFIYSGRVTEEIEAMASRLGAEAVLQKPIDAKALAQRLRQNGQ